MRKLALFVEGETEVAFTERLLSEVANQADIVIDVTTIGSIQRTPIVQSPYSSRSSNPRFYALIYNCGTDDRVLTEIADRLDGLREGGYGLVLGLRDVFPETASRHEALATAAHKLLSKAPIRAELVFAIREIEAWFIAEWSHFSRVDSRLTRTHIQSKLGIDVATVDVEAVPHPSKLMGQIYAIVSRRYRKGRFKQRLTLSAIDFDEIYLACPSRAKALSRFVSLITQFFLDQL
jgi:hypothetical protein